MMEIDTFKPMRQSERRQLGTAELNQIWVQHRHLWDEITKSELGQRKDQWKCIHRSLKGFVESRYGSVSGYLKHHKQLYFKGEVLRDSLSEGQSGSEIFFTSFSLFYLWYIPVLDDQLCQEIIHYYNRPYFWRTEDLGSNDLFNMRENLLFELNRCDYGKLNGEYGFMGPRMSIIAPNLLGEKGEPAIFDRPSAPGRVAHPRGVINSLSSTRIILVKPDQDIYRPGRYLWPRGSYYLKGLGGIYIDNLENLKDKQSPQYRASETRVKSSLSSARLLINAVGSLVHFQQDPDINSGHPNAIACRNEIMEQYENGEFAEPMNQLFEMVKSDGLGNTPEKALLEIL